MRRILAALALLAWERCWVVVDGALYAFDPEALRLRTPQLAITFDRTVYDEAANTSLVSWRLFLVAPPSRSPFYVPQV